MTAAMKDELPVSNSPKKRKPKAVPDLPTPEEAEQQLSPYPEGVDVFTYQPDGGGEPILLAINGYERPDKLWLFDISQLPVLNQTWQWMNRANIPKQIQRQAQMLPDAEYFRMFTAWFEAMKGANGPKGAVTPGK